MVRATNVSRSVTTIPALRPSLKLLRMEGFWVQKAQKRGQNVTGMARVQSVANLLIRSIIDCTLAAARAA